MTTFTIPDKSAVTSVDKDADVLPIWQGGAQKKATAAQIVSAAGGTPGGSSGQLQYNNAGALGGIAGATYAGTVLTMTKPAAIPNDTWDIIVADPTNVETGAPLFGFTGSSTVWNNGDASVNPYTDHTAFLGFNLTHRGQQRDATKPAMGVAWESKFTQNTGTIFGQEWYIRCLKVDGTEWRPFGFFAPYDNGSTGAMMTDIPYWEIRRANIVWSPTLATSVTTPVLDITPTGTATTNTIGIRVTMPEVTSKVITTFGGYGTSNWSVTTQLANYWTGAAQADLLVSGAASAYFHFAHIGVQEWAVGKNSADNFAIAASGSPDANPVALYISKTTYQTQFNYPVKFPGYTVATIPSAATSGAGSRAFISDSNATLAAGLGNAVAAGGANFVPVYSDGTNWRIG